MFETALLDSSARTGNRKRVTIPLAYALQMALVGALVLVPLINTGALTNSELRWRLVELASPPPPPSPPVAARSAAPPTARATSRSQLAVPTIIPRTIRQVIDEPGPLEGGAMLPVGVPGSIPGGTPNGVPGGIPWATNTLSPPPAALAKPAKPTQIRVGGQVEAAKAISRPMPDYPPLARLARVQGTVRLEAVIATDGRIQNLKVLTGHPLLVGAALEAVARWRYQPTLLNGEPVEVVTEIDVNFSLAD